MRMLRQEQASFADWELALQGVRLEPVLERLGAFLERQRELIEHVREDLARGLQQATTGRAGMTAEQVLRALVLQRVKDWDYRELAERIRDGYTLRQFTAFFCAAVPKHDAFQRAFVRLTPRTLRAINDAIIQAAVGLTLEDGRKLRVDTTVVETDIRYPRDSSLLWDAVRVLTRLVKHAAELAEEIGEGFHDHTRRARRRMQEIARLHERTTRRQRLWRRTYQDLLTLTEEVVHGAQTAAERIAQVALPDPLQQLALEQLGQDIATFCALADRVIEQTRRRVLVGETVPSREKVYSLFEPHTDMIKRGKVHKPVEFGHKVFLAESAIGLITDYQVLEGNPVDSDQVEPSLQRHRARFGHVPALYSGDRGFDSPGARESCNQHGVERPCIPQRGGKKDAQRTAREHTRAFKQGQKFRAGIEGRISVLFRGRGMKRCRWSGKERFELFVAAAVLTNNLLVIGRALLKRKNRHLLRAA